MKLHRNASTCPNSRALIAERVLKEGWSLTQAAEAAGVSVVTARKWAARYAAGDRALEDRDDHSRLAYVEVLPDERSESAAAFLRRGVSWFKEHGVRVQAVMSDNGSCYRSKLHSRTCYELRLKHIRTKPYRPRTNGKAERFIQTLLREWAYARLYGSSKERLSQLQRWVIHYNFRRPHGSLGHKPPGSRVKNLVGTYS